MSSDDEADVALVICEAIESGAGFRTDMARAHLVVAMLEEAGWVIVPRDPGPPMTQLEHDLLKSFHRELGRADGTIKYLDRRR